MHVAAVVTAEPKQATVHLVHNVSAVEPVNVLRDDGPARDMVDHLVERRVAERGERGKVDLLVKVVHETPKTVGVLALPPRRDVQVALKCVGRPQLLARGEATRTGEAAPGDSQQRLTALDAALSQHLAEIGWTCGEARRRTH